jgi:hypothetical protein
MEQPAGLLAIALSSETALLDWTQARVSREMIHEIALNDYEKDIEIHELAILKQLAPAPELGLLLWHPREVLELARWEEPDETEADRPPTGLTGHFKRLFACTILLRNVAYVANPDNEGEFFIATSAASVLQLVRSAIALGSDASRLGVGFLLWLHGEQSHPRLSPFVSFGVLLLQIQENLARANPLDTCAWVEEDEVLARERLNEDDVHSARWLVGLNYLEDYRDKQRLWADTLAWVVSQRSAQLAPEVDSVLRKMVHRLSEGI